MRVWAKCWMGDGWMDTPQTIMNTRAPAALKIIRLPTSPNKVYNTWIAWWDTFHLGQLFKILKYLHYWPHGTFWSNCAFLPLNWHGFVLVFVQWFPQLCSCQVLSEPRLQAAPTKRPDNLYSRPAVIKVHWGQNILCRWSLAWMTPIFGA